MRRRDGDDLPVEWIDAEQLADAGSSPRSRRWRGPYLLILVAILGAVLTVSLQTRGHRSKALPPVILPPVTLPRVTLPSVTVPPLTSPGAVTTVNIGRPILAVPAGWELFGRGVEVVRIQFRAGLVTRTALPGLESSGPVSFVPGPASVIVRPLDFVPGYVVPDGQPARQLTGLLGQGGPAFPGPDPVHLWVESGTDGQTRMALVGFDGTTTNVSIPLPTGSPCCSDGTGYLLVYSSGGGVYLAQPGGLSRVTTGTLMAAGPTRWLTLECDDQHRCSTVVIDRASGARRVLGPAEDNQTFSGGVVSPDGNTAAVMLETPSGPALHLVDMASGQVHPVTDPVPPLGTSDGPMVWSPDSSTLFFIDTARQIRLCDRQGAHLRGLGVELPGIDQLALRVTPPPGSP